MRRVLSKRYGKCAEMRVTEKTLRRMLLEGGHINGVFRILVVTLKNRIEYKVTMVKGVVMKVEERVMNTNPRWGV